MKTVRSMLLVLALALAVAPGCAQHGDLPAAIAYIPPPTPTNLQITDNGDGTYDITWDISDPIAVQEYRVYSISALTGPLLETTVTNPTVGINLGVPIGGVQIGITAVTVENVEGAMAIVVTPAP